MKRRSIVGSLAVLLVGIAVLTVFLCQEKESLLSEKYPFLSDEAVAIYVVAWPGNGNEVAVEDEEFQHILMDARVTKRAKSPIASDEGLLIHLSDPEAHVTYSVEVGKDCSISVARLEDLAGSRTYWTDCNGDLFPKLYECYLKHGRIQGDSSSVLSSN